MYADLNQAIIDGDFDLVKYYIETQHLDDVNRVISTDGSTLLHTAAANGHLKIVEYLIGRGANPNVKNVYLCTPLDDAIYNNHEEVVVYLESFTCFIN